MSFRNTFSLIPSILLGFVILTSALMAQDSDAIPLKTWSAPLYWQQPVEQSDVQTNSAKSNVRSATVVTSTLLFVGIVPCRLMDTRDGTLPAPFGPPTMGANQVRTITVPTNTRCNIPSNAQAYSLNFTVVPAGFLGYLSAWPTPNRPSPDVSILNSTTGQTIANAAVIPAGTNGTNPSIDVFVTNVTDVIIDINGYYVSQSAVPLNGTAAAPALTFNSANTGLFSAAANTVSVSTNGTSRLTVRADGDLDITGNIRQSGQLLLHTLGSRTTALGLGDLGPANTGDANTALGFNALNANTNGGQNTAVGTVALLTNNTGSSNTAIGNAALQVNTTGSFNTATGNAALASNVGGRDNTSSGYGALSFNSSGNSNTAVGSGALLANTTGFNNTALGYNALTHNVSGVNNIAIGAVSAVNLAGSNSNNILIGNPGTSSDSGVLRVGNSVAQSSFFVAAVRGTTTGLNDAVNVMIDSNGQLGTISSSRRFKQDIADMGDASAGLMKLRPVVFHYKQPSKDGSKRLEYGLVAEEVAEVYPDLVTYTPDGQVETVQYHKVNAMLLNEVQKQNRQLEAQQQRALNQEESIARQNQQIQSLESRMSALSALIESRLPATTH